MTIRWFAMYILLPMLPKRYSGLKGLSPALRSILMSSYIQSASRLRGLQDKFSIVERTSFYFMTGEPCNFVQSSSCVTIYKYISVYVYIYKYVYIHINTYIHIVLPALFIRRWVDILYASRVALINRKIHLILRALVKMFFERHAATWRNNAFRIIHVSSCASDGNV